MGKFSDILQTPIMRYEEPDIRPGDVGVRVSSLGNLVTKMPYQDLEAWRDFIGKWDVQFPLQVKMCVKRNGPSVFIRLEADVPNSRSASSPGLATLTDIAIDVLVPSHMPIIGVSERWVRALLRWFVLHELDEWILVNGQRIFDPHDPTKPPPTPENS